MVRRSPTVASRIWPAWPRVAETTEERLGLAQADPGMPGDLVAVCAHVGVSNSSGQAHGFRRASLIYNPGYGPLWHCCAPD